MKKLLKRYVYPRLPVAKDKPKTTPAEDKKAMDNKMKTVDWRKWGP